MRITSQFDSGNIEVLSLENREDIQLKIKNDNQSEFFQWFHFKLESEIDLLHRLTIVDLDKSAYPEGWVDYQAVASYARQTWFRVPTKFENET